jgi:hypothetical protein
MSLGIGVVLEDGALLVTDGRRTRPMGDPSFKADDDVKIDQVAPLVGAISFGFVQATENSVVMLKNYLASGVACGTQQFQQAVLESVEFGWNFLIQRRLEGAYDLNHPAMRAGLIVGGLDAGGVPFVTGTLIRPNPAAPGTNKHHTLVHTEPHNLLILGGEEQGAEDDFARRALEAYQRHRTGPGGSLDAFVPALRDAAAETIRMVAATNTGVGGTIRYASIRRGSGYTAGHLTEQGMWT